MVRCGRVGVVNGSLTATRNYKGVESMNGPERQRFDFLREGPCVPVEYVRDYYGLTWPLSVDLRQDFEAWRGRLRRPAHCGDEAVSRYELESFMQQKDVETKKSMGARLGMTVDSLEQVLSHLSGLQMRRQRYDVYPDLVARSLSEDLVRNLPGLKFRVSSDHNAFCARLHSELQNELKIEVEPLFCATSDILQDDSRQYAREFDCITLAPLSGRHQIWLDFRKPLNLGFDRCSKLFYAENREALRPYCAGTQEPDDVDEYIQLPAGQQNG
jgi:hypothetical protein